MINLHNVTEEEMLKNWALAEVVSIRRQKYLDELLSPDLIKKIQQQQYDFTEDEWRQMIDMIRSTRAELLDGLLSLKIKWFQGELPVEEVGDLEMMNWPPFVDLAGSRKLLDLVRAFQKGNMPPNHHEFATNLERIKKEFSINKVQGMPIVVSPSKEPPYMLVEGFTRLSALLLNMLEGKSYGNVEIPVILGVSERLNEWAFY